MFLSVANIVGLLVAVVAIGGRGAAGTDWSHSDASTWAEVFPNCGGEQQSPVNLDRFDVSSGGVREIQFNNYGVMPTTQTVTNDGHSLKVDISSTSDAPSISWGGSWFVPRTQYNFAQYHFHWGSENGQGSEHTLNTVRYPMELHLVHYNDKYADIGTAVSQSDGLAVLGIFFVISTNDNPALVPLLEAIAEVADYGASDVHSVDKDNLYALASLLPSDIDRFYRYDGSLTTPTCDESVLWTVYETPIEISEDQMAVFRSLTGPDGSSSDNFRPLQELNGRTVNKMY